MVEVAVLALRSFAFVWLCVCVRARACLCVFCLVWLAVLVFGVSWERSCDVSFVIAILGWNSSSANDDWVGCLDRSVWVVERFWMSMGDLSIPCFWVRFCEVDPKF